MIKINALIMCYYMNKTQKQTVSNSSSRLSGRANHQLPYLDQWLLGCPDAPSHWSTQDVPSHWSTQDVPTHWSAQEFHITDRQGQLKASDPKSLRPIHSTVNLLWWCRLMRAVSCLPGVTPPGGGLRCGGGGATEGNNLRSPVRQNHFYASFALSVFTFY